MTPSASIPRPPPTNPAPVWHAQSTDAALAALAATAQGLTQAEAEQRLAAHGPNSLPTPPAPSALMRLLRQFNNLLLYVLMAAATVTAFMGHWVDTGVIAAVVVLNAVIGFAQLLRNYFDHLRRV